MIPKTIHYCWFGGNPKPKQFQKIYKSWKKYCPDYRIVEWNETNYDLSLAPLYVKQAYQERKWAFVTDYVRLWIIYNYGGIYLDTDVEVKRSFDPLLQYDGFFGFEDSGFVATGLGFGAIKGLPLLKDLIDDYIDIPFILNDGTYDETPCPGRNFRIFSTYGIKRENQTQFINPNIVVFSTEYFCPLGYYSGELKVTKNTYSIHHYMASWQSKAQQKKHKENLKQSKKRARYGDFNTVKNKKGLAYACLYMLKNLKDYI